MDGGEGEDGFVAAQAVRPPCRERHCFYAKSPPVTHHVGR